MIDYQRQRNEQQVARLAGKAIGIALVLNAREGADVPASFVTAYDSARSGSTRRATSRS